MHIFSHFKVLSVGMHLKVTAGLVAAAKEYLSLLAQVQTCHSCSWGISTEIRAWLSLPVLRPQATYNVFRNLLYDLTDVLHKQGSRPHRGWRYVKKTQILLTEDKKWFRRQTLHAKSFRNTPTCYFSFYLCTRVLCDFLKTLSMSERAFSNWLFKACVRV